MSADTASHRPTEPVGATVRLRGRESELALASKRLDALNRGRGGVILIRGDAGIGKSALLFDVESMARERGFRVFHGDSDAADSAVPLAPLLAALLGSDDPPVDAGRLRELSGSPDQRFWLLQELETGLERAAAVVPLFIGLDDLQWADAATLMAVGSLPRRLEWHRILWVLVVRSGRLETPVRRALARIRGTEPDILSLRRLDDAAVERVCQDVLGGAPDAALREAVGGALGHPFLLVELLRGLRDEGLVDVHDGVAHLMETKIPQRVHQSVADQIDRLARPTRELLEMASILGGTFSVGELAALMEVPAATLLESVREALDVGLVVEAEERLAFRHDLVREAIDASIPPSVKRALQRRAMEVMLAQGSPPADLAPLVMKVAGPGDAAATDVLQRAAMEIGQVAPSVAAPLIVRALELTPIENPAHSDRFLAAIELLAAAGQAAEAIKLLDEQSIVGAIDHLTMARARLGIVPLLMQYSATEAVRQCRQALEFSDIPTEIQIHGLSLMTLCLDVLGSASEAAEAARSAVEALDGRSDPVATFPTLLPQALAAYSAGDWRSAMKLADRASEVIAQESQPQLWLIDAWKCLMLIGLERIGDATVIVDAGAERALRAGILADVRIWSMIRCRELLCRGALADARAEAEAVLELSDEMATGVRDGYISHVAHYVIASVAIHTADAEDLAAAQRWAARTIEARECTASVRMASWALARLASTTRASSSAEPLDADLLDPLTLGLLRVSDPRRYTEAPTLVSMLRARGQPEEAVAVTERLGRAVNRAPDFPLLPAASVHARAVLDDDPVLAEEAVELYRDCGQPLVRALALEDAGRLLPDDKSDRAVGYLDTALGIYQTAGAERDCSRVRGYLRLRGVRRPAATPRRPSDWPELSESEAAVVRLVATGATNREVGEQLHLSPHTVNAHLRHVFGKLDIHSRVELAALAAERRGRQRLDRPDDR